MLKDLIKVSNSLDSKGFRKEADELDRIIRKLAQDVGYPGGLNMENRFVGMPTLEIATPPKGMFLIPGDKTYGYVMDEGNASYTAYKLPRTKINETNSYIKLKSGLTANLEDRVLPAAGITTPMKEHPGNVDETPMTRSDEEEASTPEVDDPYLASKLRPLLEAVEAQYGDALRIPEDNKNVKQIAALLGKERLDIWRGISTAKLKRIVEKAIRKAEKSNASDDALFAEASRKEKRISKIASLLSGEFNGLAKSVRR
jgi:hypothetical protein